MSDFGEDAHPPGKIIVILRANGGWIHQAEFLTFRLLLIKGLKFGPHTGPMRWRSKSCLNSTLWVSDFKIWYWNWVFATNVKICNSLLKNDREVYLYKIFIVQNIGKILVCSDPVFKYNKVEYLNRVVFIAENLEMIVQDWLKSCAIRRSMNWEIALQLRLSNC